MRYHNFFSPTFFATADLFLWKCFDFNETVWFLLSNYFVEKGEQIAPCERAPGLSHWKVRYHSWSKWTPNPPVPACEGSTPEVQAERQGRFKVLRNIKLYFLGLILPSSLFLPVIATKYNLANYGSIPPSKKWEYCCLLAFLEVSA